MNSLMRRGQLQFWRKQLVQQYGASTAPSTTFFEARKVHISYDEFIGQRREQAKRSIAVQVSSEKSFNELYNYCSAFGSIVSAQHYCIRHDDVLHYILLEYAGEDQASAALSASAFDKEVTGVPVHSSFVWFRAAGRRNATLKQGSPVPAALSGTEPTTLATVDGTHALGNDELQSVLRGAENIEDQVMQLYNHTQLNDLGIRMRFLAALQVERSLTGMFPYANAQPFGSSVNGFGKMGCDLDLILRFDRDAVEQQESESRLVFHTKENLSNGRSQTQRQMECIGDMLHLFLPGVCHVRRILQARVPIIKFHHEHLDLEVDLSMSNLTGSYMSELLYLFGELDPRVRPLTFSVRRWASACGLTNPSPGRWITNFSLTCLVIYFLQQLKQPVLPSINTLVKGSSARDIRITEDGINCTFGRDLERIGFRSRNASKVSELLLQFFEFYSQFDFHNRAVSLNEGRALAKPDHSALYIVNPLEQMLNVSKNVSLEECERLRIEVRNAAWILESEVENTGLSEQEKQDALWGLVNLFKPNEQAIIRTHMFFKPRMVEVSDLFEKSTDSAQIPKELQQQTQQQINFKNSFVRQQVQNVKATGRNDLKQIRVNAAASITDAKTTSSTAKGRRSR